MNNIFGIIENLTEKNEKRIAALTPDERAELERRQENRLKRYIQERGLDKLLNEFEAIAKELDKTYPSNGKKIVSALMEYSCLENLEKKSDEELERIFCDELPSEYYKLFLDPTDADLADMSLKKLRAQEADLKAARKMIDNLLDANLKAQDMRLQLDRLQQTADRNGQGVAALVQHLPNAKKPKTISWTEAASIFYPSITARKTNGEFCYTEEERKRMIDSFSRNCRTWIKRGICPKSGTPISWDDLASTQTWKAWVEQEKIDARKPRIVSEKTGLVEDQRGRRRSPTAQSGK